LTEGLSFEQTQRLCGLLRLLFEMFDEGEYVKAFLHKCFCNSFLRTISFHNPQKDCFLSKKRKIPPLNSSLPLPYLVDSNSCKILSKEANRKVRHQICRQSSIVARILQSLSSHRR